MDLWTCVPARDYPNYGNEDRKNINEGGSPLWGRIPWIGVLDCLNRKGGAELFSHWWQCRQLLQSPVVLTPPAVIDCVLNYKPE